MPATSRRADPKGRHPAITVRPSGPAVPDGLGEAGARYWADVWRVAASWLSAEIDAPVVELAARTFEEIDRYRQLGATPLLKEPIVSPSGAVVGSKVTANPAIKLARDAEKQLGHWLDELGLTPSSRARLGFTQVRAESALDKLAARREKRLKGG